MSDIHIIDMSPSISRSYLNKVESFRERLGELQRECREKNIPVMIIIEGWCAAGISSAVNELLLSLDSRGTSVHPIGEATEEEKNHDFFWRFWRILPSKGRIAVLDRSWYSRAIIELFSGIEWENKNEAMISAIRVFERMITDDGILLIKVFLEIDKDEQKRRLDAREKSLSLSWMVTEHHWLLHRNYDNLVPIIKKFHKKTSIPKSPWAIVDATDWDEAVLAIYDTVVQSIEKRLKPENLESKHPSVPIEKNEIHKSPKLLKSPFQNVDLAKSITKDEYELELKVSQEILGRAQYLISKRKIPLIILFEGWDAAGKGGTILRLARVLNPRTYRVIPVGKPTETESQYHYLWRFWTQFPANGHITIFDRSWYGRVLVERVEGFTPAGIWSRAYQEINEMEKIFTENGGGLVKFWLEIDQEEQLKRFNQRTSDPRKTWKITDEDWRNRNKWNEYREAVDEMVARTSTPYAPWTIVESNSKHYARIKTLNTVIKTIERLLS